MTTNFENQVAIVTGAASGLGLAISKKLHELGAHVALLDLNESALQEVAQRLGAGTFVFPIDLTNEEQVANVINEIGERFGQIDVLINSAGVTGATNIKSHEVETPNLRFVFEVNFMASFFTTRAV